MHKLRALAPLLVGLTFVFLAPTAKADCPHGIKFNHPHCGGGEPSGPSGPLVVRDFTDKLVGQVIDFTGNEVRANGRVDVWVQMEVDGDPRIFLVEVREFSIQSPVGATAWSLDDECRGTLYKRLDGALSNLEAAFVDDGIAHISEAGSEPAFITAESQLTDCQLGQPGSRQGFVGC